MPRPTSISPTNVGLRASRSIDGSRAASDARVGLGALAMDLVRIRYFLALAKKLNTTRADVYEMQFAPDIGRNGRRSNEV